MNPDDNAKLKTVLKEILEKDKSLESNKETPQPQSLKDIDSAFTSFIEKYEKYHQLPTFGQWREFVEKNQVISSSDRKDISDFLFNKKGMKTTKAGIVSLNSVLGYIARTRGYSLENDNDRLAYNAKKITKMDENPLVSKGSAYTGKLPQEGKQWSQVSPSFEDQQKNNNNIVVNRGAEIESAKHTDKRLREEIATDPIVNKLMENILPIPEKQLNQNKIQPQEVMETEISVDSTIQDTSLLEDQEKNIIEQVQNMDIEAQREITKTLSQQFLEESLVNKKHRAIDLSVFEKPGVFSKDFITQILLENAQKKSTLDTSKSEESDTTPILDTKGAPDQVVIARDTPHEPRIFRKSDGTEVRENLGIETESGFINVSPADAKNRYAVKEENFEQVLRTFQDSEGNIYQETDYPDVAQGYVNVTNPEGRQYAKKLEGLTRIDSYLEEEKEGNQDQDTENTENTEDTEKEEVNPKEEAPETIPSTQNTEEDEILDAEDAGSFISFNDIEDIEPEKIETTDIELVRQAHQAGTHPVLNYKGHEMKVTSISGDTMVVTYGGQRRVIGIGEELANDMREGRISFGVSVEEKPVSPHNSQEKIEEDFIQKYKTDIREQGAFNQLAQRVWYGRGEGDFLEKTVMSDSTKEAYEAYQGNLREKAQSTYSAFISKMDTKDGWDDVRKQEVAKRLRDRYYGIQYIRGRQNLLRKLRTESIEEKYRRDTGVIGIVTRGLDSVKAENPKLAAFLNISEKWKNFEQQNKKEAALLKVGGASLLFASSVVAFGGLRVLGGALGGFITRQALNSKYARINNINLHTEELIRSQHKGEIDTLQAKTAQWDQQVKSYEDRWESRNQIDSGYHPDEDMPFKIAQAEEKKQYFQEKVVSEYDELSKRSRIEQLRKQFEERKIDGVALQREVENIDRGDVRRFRANWFFTTLAAGIAGRAAAQSELLRGALTDIGIPRAWMDGYFFALRSENQPGQIVHQETMVGPEPTLPRGEEVVAPVASIEVTPDPVVFAPEPTVRPHAPNAPDPISIYQEATPPVDIIPSVESPVQVQAPIETPPINPQIPAEPTQSVSQTPQSQWKPGQIHVETKGPNIGGSTGDGTYTQHLPGKTDFSKDPTYGQLPPQQGGPINKSGPILNPNAKVGLGGTIVLDPGGNGEVRVDIGNGKNIPTGNKRPVGPGDILTSIFK